MSFVPIMIVELSPLEGGPGALKQSQRITRRFSRVKGEEGLQDCLEVAQIADGYPELPPDSFYVLLDTAYTEGMSHLHLESLRSGLSGQLSLASGIKGILFLI